MQLWLMVGRRVAPGARALHPLKAKDGLHVGFGRSVRRCRSLLEPAPPRKSTHDTEGLPASLPGTLPFAGSSCGLDEFRSNDFGITPGKRPRHAADHRLQQRTYAKRGMEPQGRPGSRASANHHSPLKAQNERFRFQCIPAKEPGPTVEVFWKRPFIANTDTKEAAVPY
ncbi:MAG: hypothetical protein AW07_02637 [Candidatus Accumulibacter sp. SK-11]|nr:MAG: hypothetical protein AW07_02637 [Candidatus Accumulibacter sp. SK-11]